VTLTIPHALFSLANSMMMEIQSREATSGLDRGALTSFGVEQEKLGEVPA
jgi:hypothetical protein